MEKHHYRPVRENHPSFSSSLLDEIYRSIDDDQELMVYRKTRNEKQSNFDFSDFSINGGFQNEVKVKAKQDVKGRSYLIENCEKVMVRRRSGVEFKRNSKRNERDSVGFNSSSSSSDSSCGGGFSSSETESFHGGASSKPKPIRTSTNRHEEHNYLQNYQTESSKSNQKHEGKFVKTKSRAMKIYGDLKKAKQPISPGGRLAAFLNSLFATNNTKNTKDDVSSCKSKSANTSTCSSASSFSRSCLSKTPSSRAKLNNNKKRSVRFLPVNVIVDEEFQPRGHKSEEESIFQTLKFVKNPINEELKLQSSDKNERIEEAARNLLRNYQKKVECEFDLITNCEKRQQHEIDMSYEDDDEDDDDAASNTSSDLFELENFSAIGMETYHDELPVYETTWISHVN